MDVLSEGMGFFVLLFVFMLFDFFFKFFFGREGVFCICVCLSSLFKNVLFGFFYSLAMLI